MSNFKSSDTDYDNQETTHNQEITHNQKPTFDELVVALKSLEKPDNSLNKHVSTIIVGSCLAIGIWVVTGMNSAQIALGEIKITVEASAESIEKIAEQQNVMAIDQAELKQRVSTLERIHNKD